jgi:hypothetical protein
MRPRIVSIVKFGWDQEGDYTIQSDIEVDGRRSAGPRISVDRNLAGRISADILHGYDSPPTFGDPEHVYEEVISDGSPNKQDKGGK